MYNNYDGGKEWSLSDSSKGAQTIKDIQEKSKLGARGEWYNAKRAPLFPSIPLDHVVTDTVHLFLRISDNLINLLILEFHRKDSIDKKKTFNGGFERSKLYTHGQVGILTFRHLCSTNMASSGESELDIHSEKFEDDDIEM